MGPDEKADNLLGMGMILWDLGEHARAVRLLDLYVKKAGENPELTAFRQDPKPLLDEADAILAKRPGLKKSWQALRDLVEDKPGFADERNKVERSQWSEVPADFQRALQNLKKFRSGELATEKPKMADDFAKVDAALTKLEALLTAAVRESVVSKRLAQGWREMGKVDQARELYLKLYTQDPDDPTVATAVVDITVDQVKTGKAPDQTTLAKALAISEKIREESGKDLFLYWTAAIQVYELNAALGGKDNLSTINKGMKFDAVNQSDPSWALVAPRVLADSRQAGDRKDVRRAANPLAVELAKRYLALFQLPGVTQKPAYKLDTVQIDGKDTTVFVALDGAALMVKQVVTEDEREVSIITDEEALKAFEKAKTAREEAERQAAEKAAAEKAAAPAATAAAVSAPAATAAPSK
jgi:tetratricopeptide (TPR) repeat protein